MANKGQCPHCNEMITDENAGQHWPFKPCYVCSKCGQQASKSETSRSDEPSELEVQAGAVMLATTPLIDAPKLGHSEWMGLSRAILKAARDMRGVERERAARDEINRQITMEDRAAGRDNAAQRGT